MRFLIRPAFFCVAACGVMALSFRASSGTGTADAMTSAAPSAVNLVVPAVEVYPAAMVGPPFPAPEDVVGPPYPDPADFMGPASQDTEETREHTFGENAMSGVELFEGC